MVTFYGDVQDKNLKIYHTIAIKCNFFIDVKHANFCNYIKRHVIYHLDI